MNSRFSWTRKIDDRFTYACQWSPDVRLLIIDHDLNMEIPIILGESEMRQKIAQLEKHPCGKLFIKEPVRNVEYKLDFIDLVLSWKLDWLEFNTTMKLLSFNSSHFKDGESGT